MVIDKRKIGILETKKRAKEMWDSTYKEAVEGKFDRDKLLAAASFLHASDNDIRIAIYDPNPYLEFVT
jgi:hypothetical protein